MRENVEFIQVREWTCPEHAYPQSHQCDCQHCTTRWECGTCATSDWVDVLNEDGSPKMRELSPWEALTRRVFPQESPDSPFLRSMIAIQTNPSPTFEWREVEKMPKIETR